MPGNRTKKALIRGIHLQAGLLLLGYTFLSKFIFVKSIVSESFLVNFFGPYFYGVAAGSLFLYLFSHEDFFHFIKDVEKSEKKKEDKYLKKYLHYGKIFSTLIIATIGGPVFSALTIRLLLKRVWYKYLLLAIGNVPSTLIAVAMGKGAVHIIF